MEIDKFEQLKTLEKELSIAGYTKEVIDEIKYYNEATTVEEYIYNLQEEKSYWEE